MPWQPTASIENIKRRAELYKNLRAFFASKNILEVETPLLCQHTVTDCHIDSFSLENKSRFLQTSPEYAMKRLIAAGSGSIYQICKSFRNGESGKKHNPEFTMLEWYRIGFDHHDLMNEIDELLQFILKTQPAEKIAYRELFLKFLTIDFFKADLSQLKKIILDNNIGINVDAIDFDTALQILLTHLIEHKLGFDKPLFLYDFPISQAALAKIRGGEFPVAERFELYINGIEIANGFHELTDPAEQQKRFAKDQDKRQENKKFIPEIDQHFIASLKSLPNCAGVAIGLDRLLMYCADTKNIQDVICFPWESA